MDPIDEFIINSIQRSDLLFLKVVHSLFLFCQFNMKAWQESVTKRDKAWQSVTKRDIWEYTTLVESGVFSKSRAYFVQIGSVHYRSLSAELKRVVKRLRHQKLSVNFTIMVYDIRYDMEKVTICCVLLNHNSFWGFGWVAGVSSSLVTGASPMRCNDVSHLSIRCKLKNEHWSKHGPNRWICN